MKGEHNINKGDYNRIIMQKKETIIASLMHTPITKREVAYISDKGRFASNLSRLYAVKKLNKFEGLICCFLLDGR